LSVPLGGGVRKKKKGEKNLSFVTMGWKPPAEGEVLFLPVQASFLKRNISGGGKKPDKRKVPYQGWSRGGENHRFGAEKGSGLGSDHRDPCIIIGRANGGWEGKGTLGGGVPDRGKSKR